MPGRTPKSRKLHVLEGTYRKDRHSAVEPKPLDGFPQPDEWLTPGAIAVWRDIERTMLNTGCITQAEKALLTSYCSLTDVIQESIKKGEIVPASYIAVQTTMGSKLGLDYGSRLKMAKPEEPKQVDGWEKFA